MKIQVGVGWSDQVRLVQSFYQTICFRIFFFNNEKITSDLSLWMNWRKPLSLLVNCDEIT